MTPTCQTEPFPTERNWKHKILILSLLKLNTFDLSLVGLEPIDNFSSTQKLFLADDLEFY